MSAPEAARERGPHEPDPLESDPLDSEPQRPALYLTSPLLSDLGVRHGFFMRAGGASTGPFASLNFSTSVGDDPVAVAQNRRLGAEALGVSPDRVFRVSQVHGSDVVVVRALDEAAPTAKKPGDAVISALSDSACGVITADCVPVLVASRSTPHVAAIHSGWRGCVAGVIPRAIEAMQSLGAKDLVAAIGPHISLEAFEVSEEVALELRPLAPGIEVVRRTGARPHVDLRAIARAQLLVSGLTPGAIDDVHGCTFLEPERFFSYRRDGAQSGRQLAAIVPGAA